MDFCDKLDFVLSALNCTNSTIARVSGIDSSVVSRFRTGDRTPRSSSSQFLKLCCGISSYAAEKGLWEKLKESCQLTDFGNPDELLHKYFISHDFKPKNSNLKSKEVVFCFFGEKLNALMNMLGVSNIRLAKTLNVDSSLISRFRNGLRTPSKNSELIATLCSYFYKRVISGGYEEEFSELLCIPRQMVTDDGDKLMIYFTDWISDKTETQITGAMDSFLEKLSSFKIIKGYLPPLNEIVTNEILSEAVNEYIGIEGLRCAVIRFLGLIASSEQPRTLKLYSDQSMDWMIDPAFSQKWKALMLAVILKKNHINVIHNITRSLPEMFSAIEKWLPLYMTGKITSFYCSRTGSERFAHTLFVAPNLAAVQASIVTGSENSGKYWFEEEEESVLYYETQFDALMEMSKPLVQVFNHRNVSEYHFYLGEMAKQPGKTKKLLLSLSISTMPKTLLEKILIRNGFDRSEIEQILILHSTRVRQFEKELQNGGVTEFVSLPNDEDLFSGRAELNLSNLFLSRPLTYTIDEYSEHISAILSLLTQNQNYSFVPLPDYPFVNIQISLKCDVGVMVLKSDDPSAGFWFGHPMMSRAFDEYLNVLGEKSQIPENKKLEIITLLKKYIC